LGYAESSRCGGWAYDDDDDDDDVVVMKGVQLVMSAGPVAVEAETQMREDDVRTNKSGEVEST
jgi:hypothetical protein